MKLTWKYLRIVMEPSCAVPLAIILKNKERFAGKRVGVVVTGGEPCARKTIGELLAKIKDAGLSTKLDTNGSFPRVLEDVIERPYITIGFAALLILTALAAPSTRGSRLLPSR